MRRRRPSSPASAPPALSPRLLQEQLDDLSVLAGKNLAAQIAVQRVTDIRQAEFKVFSQFGDDGIVEWLVGRLGLPAEQQRFVEIGVEDYREANTRFLLVNRNWSGLIVDSGDAHVRRLAQSSLLWRHDIHAVTALVDRENVNDVLGEHGFDHDLGLLSLDVDGNDYWIWDALEAQPALVAIEYNSLFGPTRAVTVPYDASFDRTRAHFSNLYFGASLAALASVADRKGYGLAGSNSAGNNAYFVRRDLARGLPAPSVAEAYVESRYRESRDEAGNLTYLGGRDRVAQIEHLSVLDLKSQELVRIADL
ncbi:MAG: hypothetical protein QOH02_550 [Gaiellaceae bacterium]|nr:hypothetical protein [Gaiellaceae bacterium]MDX6509108.1 hypothetical protein [Gaiellaceae bacterium]